jgi:twinkle protein
MELNGFTIEEYNVHKIKEGAKTSTCPVCSEGRKKKNDKCMSVFWDTGLGQCNHCGETTQLHTFKKKDSVKVYVKPPSKAKPSPYSDSFLKYMLDVRGLNESTLKRFKITEEKEWMPQVKDNRNCICFNYYLNNELTNIKYRDGQKNFKLFKGAEKIFYNIDQIRTTKECVIVEGEFDALSFGEAGINNVVSVPNGFTAQGNVNLDYLDDYYDYFGNKKKIYLALDNDEAGLNGQKELIRRLGAEKCYLVNFIDCKDSNEYLIKYGVAKLRETLKDAEPVPLEHIETLKDFETELDDFFINGCPKGYESGIRDLDNIYTIEDGQYCVVTGTPQSGKSEVVDAICLGYSLKYGFKTAFCSPENKPNKFHSAKIIKKVLGDTPNDINDLNYKSAKEFVNDHFTHIEYDEGYNLQSVLEKFGELVKRKGIKVFVIDPFNKVKLKGASGNINEYTNEYLNLIDVFCKKYSCFVYLVMHPVKMSKEEGKETYMMPTAYNIKGGGEVFDMSYHILGIVKDKEKGLVRLHTLKVKFQHLGEPDCDAWFGWNFKNGRYNVVDFDPEEDETRKIQPNEWDNKPWIINDNTQTTESKKDVFKEVSPDDFENSVWEGNVNDVPF